jgi:hypothetical protein
MRETVRLALLLLLATALLAAGSARARDAELCADAIRAAEGALPAPAGLLGAVALSESGRYDPARRRTTPWTWTVNSRGDGRYFATKEEAIAHVEGLRRSGRRNIDVGCMQINLMHHPDAFASLEEAFDPWRNVTYGAGFLSRLQEQTRSWDRAVERYHTGDSEAGRAYRRPAPASARAPGGLALAGSLRPRAVAGVAAPPAGAERGILRVMPAAGPREGRGGVAAVEASRGRIGGSLLAAAAPRPRVFPERRPAPAMPGRGAAGPIPASGRVEVLRPSPPGQLRPVVRYGISLPGSRLRLVSSRQIPPPAPP